MVYSPLCLAAEALSVTTGELAGLLQRIYWAIGGWRYRRNVENLKTGQKPIKTVYNSMMISSVEQQVKAQTVKMSDSIQWGGGGVVREVQ